VRAVDENKVVLLMVLWQNHQIFDDMYHTWIKCNNMVLSWILNLVLKIAVNMDWLKRALFLNKWSNNFSAAKGHFIDLFHKIIHQWVITILIYIKGLWDELSNYHLIPTYILLWSFENTYWLSSTRICFTFSYGTEWLYLPY